MSKQMPPKVISGGDNPYDIHDAKLSSSATAHESSSVTAHEISNTLVAKSLEVHSMQFTELSGRCSVFERPLSDAKRPLFF